MSLHTHFVPSRMTTIRVDDEIVLRRPSLSDAEEVFALLDSNREDLGRWLPWVYAMRTVEDERRWIEDRALVSVRL